jgi:hypothetical protein
VLATLCGGGGRGGGSVLATSCRAPNGHENALVSHWHREGGIACFENKNLGASTDLNNERSACPAFAKERARSANWSSLIPYILSVNGFKARSVAA